MESLSNGGDQPKPLYLGNILRIFKVFLHKGRCEEELEGWFLEYEYELEEGVLNKDYVIETVCHRTYDYVVELFVNWLDDNGYIDQYDHLDDWLDTKQASFERALKRFMRRCQQKKGGDSNAF